MTVVDGVVNDFAGDAASDVDSVAISVVSSVVTSGGIFVVTDTVDDITFIVEGFVVINLADVSDGSESAVTVIGNVFTLSEVTEVLLVVDSSGNRFDVVIEVTGDIIAVVDLTADVTDGIDDENVVDDNSSDDPVNATVDNVGVVDNSSVVSNSVDEIIFAV